MKNILFAIGHKETEEVLKKALPSDEFNVVGIVTYKGGILKNVEDLRPDIVVIRENIIGNENILDIIYEVRAQFPAARIVFFSDNNNDEDNKIATLVSFGIYDILTGKTLKLVDMVEIIKSPRTLKDMGKFKITNLPFQYAPKESPKEEAQEEKKGLLKKIFKDKEDKVIKSVVEPYEKEVANKEIILSNTEKEIENLKETINEKEKKIKVIKEKSNVLANRKTILENEITSLTVNQNSLTTEIDNLEGKKRTCENLYIEKKNEKLELEKDILSRESEIESLKFQIQEIKNKGFSIEDKTRLELEKKALENSTVTVNNELISIKKEIEEKSIKLDSLKIEYEKYQNDEISIDEQYEKIKNDINILIEEKINEKRSLDIVFTSNKEKLETIKEEINILNSQVQELSKEYETSVLRKETLLAEKDSLEKNLNKILIEIDNLLINNNKVLSDFNRLSSINIEDKNSITSDFYTFINEKLLTFKKIANEDKDDYIDNKKIKIDIKDRASNKCQLISFLGSKSGVGNSTIALNISAALAENYKVLYIETNDKYPYSSYLYELNNVSRGLEFALKCASVGNTKEIYNHILKSCNKNVSWNMEFLTFSQAYLINEISENTGKLSQSTLKTLIRELKADSQYDYIIVDVKSDDNEIMDAFLNGSMYTDLLYITLTQDVHSVGCAFNKNEKIYRGNGSLENKTYYIVNKYNNNCKLKIKNIAEWIEISTDYILTITMDSTLLSNLSVDGNFYSLQKGKGFIFSSIISTILSLK